MPGARYLLMRLACRIGYENTLAPSPKIVTVASRHRTLGAALADAQHIKARYSRGHAWVAEADRPAHRPVRRTSPLRQTSSHAKEAE